MDSKKILSDIFKPIFKKNGFLKKGTSRYLVNKEIIGIFNIQKSQWSDLCYLNIALYIRKDEPLDFLPNYGIGHIRFRGGEGSNINKELQELLSFNEEINQSKKEILEKFLEENIIPYYIENSTILGLRNYIKTEKGTLSQRMLRYDGELRLNNN